MYLIPKQVVLGIGCKKNTPPENLSAFVEEILAEHNIFKESIKAIASIDLKKEEKVLLSLAKELDVPFVTYTAEELSEFFIQRDFVKITVCTATEYGKILLPTHPNMTVLSKRLDEALMFKLMEDGGFDAVFDTTHPYAVIVSENIKNAADKANLPYYRVVRASEDFEKTDNIVFVSSMDEAVGYLENTTGNILCTTGSKELAKLCKLTDYKERVYARIISNPEMVKASFDLGFQGKHLICMQGPFSEELNIAMIHQFDISYMLTKNSGKAGGFLEKVGSAQKTGICVVIIGRPQEESGLSVKDVMERFG